MTELLRTFVTNTKTTETKSSDCLDIKTIEIQARRWFQKSYGNTYFSGEIYVNDKLAGKVVFEYGYGDHCIDFLFKVAQETGKLPLTNDRLWQVCRDNDIKLLTNIVDVKRKKDL